MARGRPLVAIRRQLGHANLGSISVYLEGIDGSEIIRTGPPTPRRCSQRAPDLGSRRRHIRRQSHCLEVHHSAEPGLRTSALPARIESASGSGLDLPRLDER
jgi:hypothetical protein